MAEIRKIKTLKPCPFCGSNNVQLVIQEASRWVECLNCETQGPLAKTKNWATRKWNRRLYV